MKNLLFSNTRSNAAGGNIRRWLSVFLLISLTVSLYACSSGPETQDDKKSGGSLQPDYVSQSESVVVPEGSGSLAPNAQNDPPKEPTTLVLAAIGLSSQLRKAIVDFNTTHDSVHIDIKDYSEYNTAADFRAGYERFLLDVITGSIPDILVMSSELPYKKIASAGILEDLYPYLDADPELSREDFFPNILHALELDGHLYLATPDFILETVVGSAAVVGTETGLSYDEYYQCLASMPEGCRGFAPYEADKETMLSGCSLLEMDNLIDWENGTCHFDSEEFIGLLKFANSISTSGLGDMSGDAFTMLAQGQQMLSVAAISSLSYLPVDYDHVFGGETTFVGYPIYSGIGHKIYLMNGALSISSLCRDKASAWEFIRTFFSEQVQNSTSFLPTNVKAFENKIAEATTVKYETDENGQYVLDENGEKIPVVIASYFDGFKMVDIYSLTERQAQLIRKAVGEAEKLCCYESTINNIILEGARPYFAGQRTAEEAAAIIQSRAAIYVSEQG